MSTTNGTNGRVYGGDPNLVHVEDGQRHEMGRLVAEFLDDTMRAKALERGEEAIGKELCAGCAMIVLFNAAILLAQANGQTLTELGSSMSLAFEKLAQKPTLGVTEEIEVILDPPEPQAISFDMAIAMAMAMVM